MEMWNRDFYGASGDSLSTSGNDNSAAYTDHSSKISKTPDHGGARPKMPTVTNQSTINYSRKFKKSSKRTAFKENSFQRSVSTSASKVCETEMSTFDFTESFDVLHSVETTCPTTDVCVWSQPILNCAIDELLIRKSPSIVRLAKPLLDSSEEFVWKELPFECQDVAVLLASLNGNVAMLKYFLESGADANASDLIGRRALHFAASSSSSSAVHCINLLINYEAEINIFDKNKEAAPLFCASASGRIDLVEALLNNRADVNAGAGDSTSSALLWSVRGRNLACTTRLIEAEANVNNVQAIGDSPIHVAAYQGDVDCLKLLLKKNADAYALNGPEGRNALHFASCKGNVECIRLLLQANINNIDKQDADGRTPLHLAAIAQSFESVELLLDNGARHDICDGMKETPLHSASGKFHRSMDIVRLLVSRGANVNMKNQFDQSPLHLAAINEHSKLASFLILSGADLSSKNRANNSAMELVVRRVPDALSAISRKLDSAIEIACLDPTDADCELRLDLQVLIPSGNQQRVGEMAMLMSMIAADQRQLLLHPVIGAFLHLKWKRIRTTFVVSLIFQLCYVLSLTMSIVTNSTCIFKSENFSQNIRNDIQESSWHLIVIFSSITGCKELFQLYCNPCEYVKDKYNYVHIFSLIGTGIIVLTRTSPNPITELNSQNGTDYCGSKYVGGIDDTWPVWKHHVAAILIIVTWINLMMHIGRFPAFGLYVQMFNTVALNMSKLLATYMCLIIGFALGFAVLFPQSKLFSYLSLLTTIVMMTGETNYHNHFDGKNDTSTPKEERIKYEGTTHLVFLLFILLIVIVLMNLLVGLAVQNIQGLMESAGLDRMVRVTKQIARMEMFIFFPLPIRLLKKWLRRECLQRKLLVVSPKAKRTYNFKPNDPRDKHFPPDIKESLLAITVQRMANKKKGLRQNHIPAVQTSSAMQVDAHNEELITNVLDRVDELFKNYMSEIVRMNETMNEKLARFEHNRFRPPLAQAWTSISPRRGEVIP